MRDCPWIPQGINESRMFQNMYDTCVVSSVYKAKTKYIFLPQPGPPPLSALEGGGEGEVFLISPPLSNFIGLSVYVNYLGFKVYWACRQLVFAVCNLCANKNLGAPKAHQGGGHTYLLWSVVFSKTTRPR